MNKYTVTFLNPFVQDEQVTTDLSAENVTRQFQGIDWLQINNDVYERHDTDLIHDYYFFEVGYTDPLGGMHKLNLSGQYVYGPDLKRSDLVFVVTYSYPEETTSKGFLGLGSPKTKTTIRIKEMWDCSMAFTECALAAFLKDDSAFLDHEIFDRASDD